MDINVFSSVTRFEHLPDELFLIILAYVPVKTLYHGFFNINERLNSIIASVRPMSSIALSEDRDPLLMTAIEHFASQTISLYVDLWCQQLDLTQFRSIQSVYFCRPTFFQLMAIHPDYLPNLRMLSIEYATPLKYDHIDDFYRLLLSNRFTQLRCVRQDGADLRLKHYVVENKCLYSLFIGSCELQHWPDLLKAVPTLCRFTTTIFYLTPPIAVPTSFQHMALRCFNVVFDEYYDVINDLEKVLWFTPVLTDLAVRCTHSLSPINFFGLFNMLTERTPRLKCFQCRLNILVRKNETIPEVNHIRQISSLFATIHYKQHEKFNHIRILATEPMMDEYRRG